MNDGFIYFSSFIDLPASGSPFYFYLVKSTKKKKFSTREMKCKNPPLEANFAILQCHSHLTSESPTFNDATVCSFSMKNIFPFPSYPSFSN